MMATSRKTAPKSKKARASTPKRAASVGQSRAFRDHDSRERGHRYAQIIARAWADEEFKQRLMSDPRSVLGEFDVKIPRGAEVRVVTEPPARKARGEIVFVLPEKPRGWIELESRPLTASPNDDWLDGGGEASGARVGLKVKPKPKPFPCAKCWNGCC
jgi:hypothetical protein